MFLPLAGRSPFFVGEPLASHRIFALESCGQSFWDSLTLFPNLILLHMYHVLIFLMLRYKYCTATIFLSPVDVTPEMTSHDEDV